MAVLIYLFNAYNRKITLLGDLEDSDVLEIAKEASKKQLKCLSFLDYIGYSIFNLSQINEIKSELHDLSNNTKIASSIAIIQKAISQIPENFDFYLMFEGE
jgi:hypothetical protein